jgi:hypothetical protein
VVDCEKPKRWLERARSGREEGPGMGGGDRGLEEASALGVLVFVPTSWLPCCGYRQQEMVEGDKTAISSHRGIVWYV